MSDVFIIPGVRTPFVKSGGAFAGHSAIELATPVIRTMAARAAPDMLVWSQVIPDATVSNIARELVYAGELDPGIPAWSTVLACASSLLGATAAAGMIGRSSRHLALVGGVETMTHVPIALRGEVALEVVTGFRRDPAGASARLAATTAADFDLPLKAWANRVSGRSQGEHTEDTARRFNISREDQDHWALRTHRAAVAAREAGFFKDLVQPFAGVEADTLPRADTSLERLGALPPVYGPAGTITAGNASPVTDGAASVWVADAEGAARLGAAPLVRLVDWQMAALDFRLDEGMLMAPARAIPQLLARQGLKFADVALWEVHEAFAAQLLANLQAASDADYRLRRAGVAEDLGDFPWERVNPNGGSLAIGHPFAATGARLLSQTAKSLASLPSGSRAILSICADGGQGVVALLERS